MAIDSQDIITEEITHDIVDENIEHSLSEEVISHIIEPEQGPPGPGASPSDFSYTHNQTTPDVEWTINHDLGFNPNIQINDSSGDLVLPSKIIHDSINSLRIQFLGSMAGVAYLS